MENNKFYDILLRKGKKLHKKYIYKYIGKGNDRILIYSYRHHFKSYIECRPNKEKYGYYTCDKCKQILEAVIQLENEKKFRNTTVVIGHYSYKTYPFREETINNKGHRTMVTNVYLLIDCHGQVDNKKFKIT